MLIDGDDDDDGDDDAATTASFAVRGLHSSPMLALGPGAIQMMKMSERYPSSQE